MTPAMYCGLTSKPWTFAQVIARLDVREATIGQAASISSLTRRSVC